MSSLPSIRRAIVAFPQIETEAHWVRVLALREHYDPLVRFIPPRSDARP